MPLDESRLECWTFAGWEPDRHYRRLGSRGTTMLGRGAWVPDWRRRVVSNETVAMMRDSGITVAVTHFYKGFGIRAESTEWPRLREFVALCHEGGIRVWGYVQGMSLYYETLLAEVPHAMDWAARRHNGTPDCWSSAYYRLAPCLTAEGYLEYVRGVIRIGLNDIGLDGIHNDNSYYKHCYCERCIQRFRAWLNAMPDLETRTGLPTADHVLPPPPHDGPGRIHDPLQIAWIEFGVQVRQAAYRSFYETVKSCKADAPYETNPAFPKRTGFKTRLAVDPAREGRICDAVCAENSNLARVENGRIHSQAEAYLYADAGDYHVMNTTWLHGRESIHPPDSPGMLWAGLAEEFSYHAAMLGNNWLLRPTADGRRIIGDDPARRTVHAEAVRFFRDLHASLRLGRRRQWAEVALFVEPDSLTLGGAEDLMTLRAALSWFLAKRIPVRFLYDAQSIPDSVRVLAVCQQSCLSDRRLAEIAAVGRRGVAVLVTGLTGRFDEWAVARNESDWRAWRNSPGFTSDAGEPPTWADTAGAATMEATSVWPSAACDRELGGLLRRTGWMPSLSIDAPATVLLNTEAAEDGRLLIHLREQSGSEEPVHATVRLAASTAAGRRVTLHAPRRRAEILCSHAEGDVALTLPAFTHYALLDVAPSG